MTAARIIKVESCIHCPYVMVKGKNRGCANPDFKHRWHYYFVGDIEGDFLEGCPLPEEST